MHSLQNELIYTKRTYRPIFAPVVNCGGTPGGIIPGGIIPMPGGIMPGGAPKPGGGGGGAKPAAAGLKTGMLGGGGGIAPPGPTVCWGVKPGGGGGWARAPANWPWYGPWKGIIMPGVAAGGRAETGRALFLRACAARRRSAGVPWRSPLPSFLKAYCTDIALFIRNWPFMASMAASEDSKSVKETKP